MTHEEIQILISAYFDGEVTPSEKNIVEEHLSSCAACQKDFKNYQAMSSSLSKWANESLSPDEEIKVQKSFEQRRGSMFTKRSTQVLVTTLALTVIVGSVVQTYVKRGLQGQLKSASDNIGDQFSPGAAKGGLQLFGSTHARMRDAEMYSARTAAAPQAMQLASVRAGGSSEPYYMKSDYSLAKNVESNKRLTEGLSAFDSAGYRTRQAGGGAVYSAAVVDAKTAGEEGANYYQNTASSYYAIPDEDRKKIQRADVTLLVENAFKTKSVLTDLMLQSNGIIVKSEFNRSLEGAGQGTMIAKVSPKDLEHTLQQIRKLGEVQNENESSVDVTDQYADAQKSLDKYASDKDKLQKSLNNFKLFNPTTDTERENTQRQIAQTEEEIKAVDRVIKFYKEQTSMSLIVVNYYDNYKTTTVKDKDTDHQWKTMLDNKWKASSNASLEVFFNILFGIIYLLSFIAPVLIWVALFGILYFIVQLFIKK